MDIKIYFVSGREAVIYNVKEKIMRQIIEHMGGNSTLEVDNGVINLKYVEQIEFIENENKK